MHEQLGLRKKETEWVTWLGLGKNLFLATVKMIFGIWGHSQALIADSLHSIADLLSDGMVLIAAKYGNNLPDNNHPYGHRRIETLATVGLALLLIITGAFILFDSIHHLFKMEYVESKPIVLGIALGSTIFNEILFQLTHRIGKKFYSNLLIANAWHHRSDAASSLIVAIGISGSLLGYPYLDSLAAFIVGILIIKMGAELAWTSTQELIDTGVDNDTLEKMRHIIAGIPGVKAIHQLRNRVMGGAIFVDVHIQVMPFLTVSEGHYIAHQVHFTLMEKMPQVTDVTVHIDPENDEIFIFPKNLPDRDKVLAILNTSWAKLPESQIIQKIHLHYLSGKIYAEIKLPISLLEEGKKPQVLKEAFIDALKPNMLITDLELWFG